MIGRSIPLALQEINDSKIPDNGYFDLQDYIGDRDRTQEMKTIKNLATESIFSDESVIRVLSRNALRLCSLELINDVIIEDNKLYLILGPEQKKCFVYDIPVEYHNQVPYGFREND